MIRKHTKNNCRDTLKEDTAVIIAFSWTMTIIVTGGCGFVGTALIKALLLKQSSKIVILDMITPKPELQELATFVWTDITDKKAVFQAFQAYEEDISCVFHVAGFGLAGTANLPAFDTQTKKVNVEGTRNVIDACIKFNVKALGNFFQAASRS